MTITYTLLDGSFVVDDDLPWKPDPENPEGQIATVSLKRPTDGKTEQTLKRGKPVTE